MTFRHNVVIAVALAAFGTLGLLPANAGQLGDSPAGFPARPGITRISLTDETGRPTPAAVGGLGGAPGSAVAVRTTPLTVEEFVVAGLTWAGGEDLSPAAGIRMRVREDHGWSAWLEVEPNAASDGPATRGGTEPFVTGGADGVQVLITGPVAELPGDFQLSLVAPDDAAAMSSTTALAAVESATTLAGPVFTRGDWGADETVTTAHWTPKYYPLQAAVVHHTAGTNSYSEDAGPSIVKAIFNYHAIERGWGDIGYNFLVDAYGNMYEGRRHSLPASGEVPDDVPQGWSIEAAHATGYNQGGLGISAMGDFTLNGQPDSRLVVDAMAKLIRWKFTEANLDVLADGSRVASGFVAPSTSSTLLAGTSLPRIFTHKDVAATLCPGSLGGAGVIDALYNAVTTDYTRATDTTAPKVDHTVTGTCIPSGDGWLCPAGTTITLATDDTSTAPQIFHTIDNTRVFYSPAFDQPCGTALGVSNPASCVVNTLYAGPITLASSMTLAYRAVDETGNTSAPVTETFTLASTGTKYAPWVAITSPLTDTSFDAGTTVHLSGSAMDIEDGDLTSRIVWTSSIDGALGTGAPPAPVLSAGTHTITATVTDSSRKTSRASVTITVAGSTTPPPTSTITLSASVKVIKGIPNVTLTWGGVTTSTVDIWRNGALLVRTANDGSAKDKPPAGDGAATYQVCESGYTIACSSPATVNW